MIDNFTYGIVALGKDAHIFLGSIFSNSLFSGFLAGCFLTLIVVGFILSEDPKHIPIMLRYSCETGYQKISQKDGSSTCIFSYAQYEKIHNRVRILMFGSFLSFCVMVTTILFTQ